MFIDKLPNSHCGMASLLKCSGLLDQYHYGFWIAKANLTVSSGENLDLFFYHQYCAEKSVHTQQWGGKKVTTWYSHYFDLAFFMHRNASTLGQTTQYSLISFSQHHNLSGYTKCYCCTFFSLWHNMSQVSLWMPMFVLLLKFKSVIRIVEKMDLFSWKYS